MRKLTFASLTLGIALLSAGCTPEVGSDRWCKNIEDKPKGDWSMNEAADYTKHCLFRTKK